jgi:acyl-CoA synthetase (AMP-forming)/AMP-acid ligase II
MQSQQVRPSNLVELSRHRAHHQPHQTAYRFLKDGETESVSLTYEALDQRARAIAVQLHSILPPGSRALLVYPYEASLEFITAFMGCLYAGIIAVPNHPPRNRSAFADLQARLTSSQAAVVLTTKALQGKLKSQLSSSEFGVSASRWLATESIPEGDAANWVEPDISSDTLAFLQYTSGSTGVPKGVMVTHGSLLHNQQVLQTAFGHSAQSVGVGWLPLFHDMGLIGNVLQALYLGASCVLMSPIAFIQKPIRWLQAISRYQATTSGAPNFAYDLLCRQVKDEQLSSLDLSSWDVAFTGAEPVRADTLERFAAKFEPCGFRRTAFYPCYGMAEATLFVAGGQKAAPPLVKYVEETALEQNQVVMAAGKGDRIRSLTSCGQAWLDGKIVIADPQTLNSCQENQVGEIWFSSSGIGKGYWQQAEETAHTFQAYLKDTGEGPFLRTGDLGFLQAGELFITGRLKDVLVFWGFNHYPEQIERTVEQCHPAFRANAGAAFAVPIEGEDRLVLVQEVERSYRGHLTVDEVVEVIRWTIFQEHFIDVYGIALLKPGSLPKTPSGKVQRQACRTQFLEGSLEILDQWRSPQSAQSDIPSLIKRYLNPLTHANRYVALSKSKLKRFLS